MRNDDGYIRLCACDRAGLLLLLLDGSFPHLTRGDEQQ